MLRSEDTRCPYPGLRPFEAEEADLFFGREEHVDALLVRLSRSHFVAVVGESGAGKSSLVRAGLLPALQAGFVVEAGADWRVAVMRPGGTPLTALADALLEPGVLSAAGGNPGREFALAELRRGPLGVAQLVRDAHLAERCNTLIVVDQFEELFRYCREPSQHDHATMFVELLLHASRQQQVPVFVVLTMRSDFLGDCARFRGLPEVLNDNQYLTPRLTREQIAAAIREPARVCNGVVQSDLVDQLCNDIGDSQDQLPLLQHLLMRLWDESSLQGKPDEGPDGRRPPWPRLTSELSALVGGLRSALNNHAQQIHESLPEAHRRIARSMFKCLTDPRSPRRDLRRDALVSEIAAVAAVPIATVVAVANEFRAPGRHMLMPPPIVALDGASRLDISHESLIRQWSVLSDWAREERIDAREFDRLREEAEREHDQQGELLAGRDLARALDWLKHATPTPAWAERYAPAGDLERTLTFIQKSEDQATRRRDEEAAAAKREAGARHAKLYAWISGGALVFATIIAAVIFTLWQRAEAEGVEARTQTEEAKNQKRSADGSAKFANELTNKIAMQNKLVEQQNVKLNDANLKLNDALQRAHTSQLLANALLALEREDTSLAVLLARQAATEGQSDQRATTVLRTAVGSHVPSIGPRIAVAPSRHYVPGSDKRAWIDFALTRSSVSSSGDRVIVPSAKDAIIWSTASGAPIRTLSGHTNIVGTATFSPNGDLAVTTSADATVRVWKTGSSTPPEILKSLEIVNNAIFNEQGTMLVTMSDDSRATLWDVGHYQSPRCQMASPGNFIDASFSDDQRLIVTVTHEAELGDREHWQAQIWDVTREQCPRHAVPVLDQAKQLQWASFSPHGPWLGVVMENGEATVISTVDWTTKRTILAPPYTRSSEETRTAAPPPLAWSSDGKSVAIAGGDNSLYIANIEDNRPPVQLRGHSGRVTRLAFHPTSNILLSTSKDRTARLWRLRQDKTLLETITLRGHKDSVGSGTFSRDGSQIVTAGDDGVVRLWRPQFALKEFVAPGLRAAVYSRDGRQIWISGVDVKQAGHAWASELDVSLDPSGGVKTPPVALTSGRSVTFSGSRIVSGENNGHSIRDVRNPSASHALAESSDVKQFLGSSPNGRFAAFVAQDGAKVWDTDAPEKRAEAVPRPKQYPLKCQPTGVSDDKQLMWYCADDDLILITRPGASAPLRIKRDAKRVESVRFSPSGRLLALELDDYSIEILDTRTGATSSTLRGNVAPVTGMDFSADDQLLASTSNDAIARVWDVTTGTEFTRVILTQVTQLTAPRFSPDALSLLLVARDRLLHWRCDACGDRATLLNEVHGRRVVRELSKDEETRYGISSAELNEGSSPGALHSHSAAHR